MKQINIEIEEKTVTIEALSKRYIATLKLSEENLQEALHDEAAKVEVCFKLGETILKAYEIERAYQLHRQIASDGVIITGANHEIKMLEKDNDNS